ncbi:MAG: competence/damage-inducible protein A [Negativicutes bacterium]|nr:competence/damage-inducible protein A [Negativicutes bacterium]
MIVEIVSTGTELLLGQITDTNTPYLARKCNELGLNVLYHSTVGDNPVRMSQVIATALGRADIIITTGGLGPTQGDITKEVTAKQLGLPLVLHEPSMQRIQCFFAQRHLYMPDSNLRQAMIPKGAIVLDNERGTAPGVIVEHKGKTVIHLPGPPHELEGMFESAVAPYLRQRFGAQGIILSKVLRTFGIGESSLEEQIKDYILAQSNPTIALLARSGEIHIRLTARAATETEAKFLIGKLEEKIRERVGSFIFGNDHETLEEVVGKLLIAKGLTIALAESCTGGLITSKLTDIAGSSAYLTGSIVCYANEIKIEAVGVPADTIHSHGAVSAETAIAMSLAIRDRFRTGLGVGVTGIAGPGGETPDKPVGLVHISIAGPDGILHRQYHFTGQRTSIKNRTALAALNQIRQFVEE